MDGSNYIGKNLKYLRKLKGLKQDEMLNSIGIGRATCSNYELNQTEPTIATILRISEFFGVPVIDLLTKSLEYECENVALSLKREKNLIHKDVALNVAPSVALNGNNEVNEDPAEDIKSPLNADKIDYKDALISSQAALIEQLKINIQLTQNQRDQLIIETQEQKEKYSAPTKERKTA